MWLCVYVANTVSRKASIETNFQRRHQALSFVALLLIYSVICDVIDIGAKATKQRGMVSFLAYCRLYLAPYGLQCTPIMEE